MKKLFTKSAIIAAAMFTSVSAFAADSFKIDTDGAHAYIDFKISHLGYSWISGRFNTFEGDFSFSQDNPSDAQVSVTIDATSIDSNHAERDKHIRSADFLETDKFPSASFTSTGFNYTGDGKGVLTGDLTLKGVTKSIEIEVSHIGQGDDPWGNYRSGFLGETALTIADFGITQPYLPADMQVFLELGVEGIRQ
ncbi:YceI family protein [Curvivirga sp.]|uniref:YceI family protein n=1 Tax=Curvivirga sp. TaxID=2856848 RepID=UPI003B5CF646